ncbi:MAG: DUF4293 domain-containing protein [Bacteroidota bacterium]
MIQRVQTIYLVLAAISGLMTFFLPFAHFLDGDVKLGEFAVFGVFNVQSNLLELSGPSSFPSWIFTVLTVVSAAAAVFLYKNRATQLKVTRLAMLLNLAFIAYLAFGIESIMGQLYDDSVRVLYHSGFYMPVIALPFLFLAIRGIKKDEALVKSLDRIR